MTWDLSGLPRFITDPLAAALARGRRWYVAAIHTRGPDGQHNGILRHKDPAGLEEWRQRRWRYFGGSQPEIHAVTEQIPELWRALLAVPRRAGQIVGGPVRVCFLWPDHRLAVYIARSDDWRPADTSDLTVRLVVWELLGLPCPFDDPDALPWPTRGQTHWAAFAQALHAAVPA